CPPSTFYRLRKFARRNKAVLLTASAVILAVSLTAAVSTVLIWRTNQNLQEALEREQRDSYFHRIDIVHNAPSADNPGRPLKYLGECPEVLHGWEWHYLMRLCRAEPLVIPDTTQLHGAAFSRDGEQLASAGGDGTIKIWNSRTGKKMRTFKAHAPHSVVS